ncbi:MAG: PadR family transcriptional regulator [Acidimicrobiales bacterium]
MAISKRGGEKLSGGDHLVLAFLAGGPKSAYDIKKEVASSVSFFWDAAHSQIYQQASRLSRDGYIKEAAARGPRNRRVLTLTGKGRQALREWLAEPAPLYRLSDESLIKVFFGALTGPGATVAMLRDQQAKHQAMAAEYETIRAALEAMRPEGGPPYELFTVRLGLEVEKAWLRWLDQTVAELERAG